MRKSTSQNSKSTGIWLVDHRQVRALAGPHYQKLYARVTHIWGNRKGQPSPSAMKGPRLERTASLITVPPASGKYAFQAYACRGKTLPHLCPCGTALHASNQPLSVPALARHVFFRLPFGAAGCSLNEGSTKAGLLYFSSRSPCTDHSAAVVKLDFDLKDLHCGLQRPTE